MKERLLSTVLGFPGDMRHCSISALEDPDFSQGLLPPWSQSVLWNRVLKCTFDYCKKYEVKMTPILLKFIIYPSCERALKNGRVKSKIFRKSSFDDMVFWLHMITFHLRSVLCQKMYCCWNIRSELATWKIVTIMQRW